MRQHWLASIDAKLDELEALELDLLGDSDRSSFVSAIRVWRPAQGRGRPAEHFELASDFHVAIYDGALEHELGFTQLGDGLITIRFVMDGDVEWRSPAFGDLKLSGPHTSLLWQQPGSRLELRIPGHVRQRVVSIVCGMEAFIELFGSDLDASNPIGGPLAPDTPVILPFPGRADGVLRDIWANGYTGRLRLLYIRSKVLELACLVSNAAQRTRSGTGDALTPREEAQLLQARELLEERCCHPPQIARIGRLVGLNQSKLMRGFKAKFGETIGDFCRRRRLEMGLELLERGMSVTYVAGMVGYEHHSSFTAAFRDHFGFPPKHVSRSGTLPAFTPQTTVAGNWHLPG